MSTHLHFMGIGGISMSGLALHYRAAGHRVSGCDAASSSTIAELNAAGIEVAVGHEAEHLSDVDVLITSAAIAADAPERLEAERLGLPIRRRIDLLAELFAQHRAIGVTGTHGKSTTSAMVATILLGVDSDPSIQLGAILPSLGGVMRFGQGDLFVAEVDESDPGFAQLACDVAVVTNLEDDHIAGEHDERRTYHASLGDLEAAVVRYATQARRLVTCSDWPLLDELVSGHPDHVRYGETEDADYRIAQVTLGPDDSTFVLEGPGGESASVHLAVPGRHNVANAAGALAAVHSAGVPLADAAEALARFGGIGRRWQRWGEVGGAVIIDDYAHHPTEVAATLAAARATGRRVRAVLQPHRWVRTARHWPALADAAAAADEILVLDVYGAGERAIPGISSERIVERLRAAGRNASHHDLVSAERYLADTLHGDDLVITLGAGDVWRVAEGLASARSTGVAPIGVESIGVPVSDARRAEPDRPSGAHVAVRPLAELTTLRVGGPAEVWEVDDIAAARDATSEPFRAIGAGSNLLVSDEGVDGRVVKLGKGFDDVRGFGAETDVWLGAATPLPGLVRRAQRAGLSGLEGLLGVPAVLGGAIAMNAGTRFGEMSDSLIEVEALIDGALERLSADALGLGYRHADLPTGALVVRARLKLVPSTPDQVAEAMAHVDAARKGQPKVKSAGCAFKNPAGDSAGRLIDAAGLKGLRVGDAMISYEHGNFVVNLGHATAADVEALLALVQERVDAPLELEWRRWGR